MASEASHISHEIFGEIRAGGSSLARPRADFLVLNALLLEGGSSNGGGGGGLLPDSTAVGILFQDNLPPAINFCVITPVGVESSHNVLSKDCLSFHFIHLTSHYIVLVARLVLFQYKILHLHGNQISQSSSL